MNRKQISAFFIMLGIYILCVFSAFTIFLDQQTAGAPMPDMGVSPLVLGLVNSGIVLLAYGILGLAGLWFARKVGLPGIYSEDGNWRRWVLIPLGLGLVCGLLLVLGDFAFAPINGLGHFQHPAFPFSIVASLSAGIGEEVIFRGFVFGLWSLILTWAFKRFNGRTAALWIANVIAALAFGAGHLGTVMVLTGATSPAELNPVLLAEVFLLNGVVGVVAGWRYMKDGLVAASGVHFWTDVVWHVAWGLFS